MARYTVYLKTGQKVPIKADRYVYNKDTVEFYNYLASGGQKLVAKFFEYQAIILTEG